MMQSYIYHVCSCSGARFGVQLAHDFVRHGQDEGVSRGSRDVDGFDVSHCKRLPKLTGSSSHVVAEHGWQTWRSQLDLLHSNSLGNFFYAVILTNTLIYKNACLYTFLIYIYIFINLFICECIHVYNYMYLHGFFLLEM